MQGIKPLNIVALTEDDLPELARFIHRSAQQLRREQGFTNDLPDEHPAARTQGLQSQLFESPFANSAVPPGFLLRSDSGDIIGSLLLHPWCYRTGDQTCFALASGAFFVDPAARMGGFFLFRKYLGVKGPDFFYGNSCNPNSAELWKKLRGVAVPGSDLEYLLVLRPEPVVEEMLHRKRLPRGVARLAGALTAPGRLWLNPRRTGWRVERCSDYGELAELAERHRPRELITTDRSREYLQWRYPQSGSGRHTYRFTTPNGSSGWFAIAEEPRGYRNQIRGVRLLDAVRPRQVSPKDLVAAVQEQIRGQADLLSIRHRPSLGNLRTVATYTRTLPSPESFVGTRGNTNDLADQLDIANADVV